MNREERRSQFNALSVSERFAQVTGAVHAPLTVFNWFDEMDAAYDPMMDSAYDEFSPMLGAITVAATELQRMFRTPGKTHEIVRANMEQAVALHHVICTEIIKVMEAREGKLGKIDPGVRLIYCTRMLRVAGDMTAATLSANEKAVNG